MAAVDHKARVFRTIRAPALMLLTIVLAGYPAAQAVAEPGVVEVEVQGIRDGRGHILVAVCTQMNFLQEHCTYNGIAQAHAGTVLVHVRGVPPGVYAVQAWHDENNNGHIDRDLFGIPREGIGVSRDAPIRLSPPRFDDARFEVGPDGARTYLRLRYMKG